MNIREAKMVDLNAMSLLWFDLMAYHNEHHKAFILAKKDKALVIELLSGNLKDTNSNIFLAAHQDQIVGFIICRYSIGSELFQLCRKGYIAETYVHENHRSKGIGKLLFETAEQWMINKGANHIELQVSIKNLEAQKFWKNKGFNTSTCHMIKGL